MLNVIPHALRTPITTFRGLAESLVHATDDQIHDEIGPALRRLAAQAEQLLDDLLIAAGYTTALPTGNDVATPIAPAVNIVWADLRSAAESSFELRGDESLAAMAPPGSVQKMLVHVLDNAAKYGTEGRPTTITITREGDRVLVVIDSPGTAPVDVSMLAEPFYRGEAAVMRSSGLGVGLTVSQALVTQAGGTLDLEPLDEGGLRTTLDLRAGPA